MQSVFLLLPPRRRARVHEMQHHLPPLILPEQQQQWSNNNIRELLVDCAAAISASDWHRAIQFLVLLSRAASPSGDATERLAAYFSTALARCVYSLAGRYDPSVHSLLYNHNLLLGPDFQFLRQQQHEFDLADEEHSAYRALNQVTPFIRFAHLSANQAILEAVDNERVVHIVDLNVMQGLQWPPLMQALVERRRLKMLEAEEQAAAAAASYEHDEEASRSSEATDRLDFSLTLRITGTGPTMELLQQTGSRLRDFARMMNLDFEFGGICTSGSAEDDLRALQRHLELREDEVLVVNCVNQLHRLLNLPGRAAVNQALEFIRSLSPRILTVAEKEFELVESSGQQQGFMDRFLAALEHYSAVFDSLEATLSPRSPHRLMIERLVLAKEITGVVLELDDGVEDQEHHMMARYQSFRRWRQAIEEAGFNLLPPSDFSIAQARLLLRLHYPAEGYRLLTSEGEQDGLFLCWQNKPLVAVSAWS